MHKKVTSRGLLTWLVTTHTAGLIGSYTVLAQKLDTLLARAGVKEVTGGGHGIVGHILNFLKSKKIFKFLGFILIILCLIGVILTGERSNGFKALIGFSIFILIIDYVKLKNKIILFLTIFAIFLISINFSDYIKYRYIDALYYKIHSKEDREKFLNKCFLD